MLAMTGIVGSVHALSPAQQLVTKMTDSARNLSYKGYFTYERGQQSNSYLIIHSQVDNAIRQRLVFLDGPVIEVIDDGKSLKSLYQGGKHSPQHPVYPLSQLEINPLESRKSSLDSIWQNYNVTITGHTRVADRAVTKVQLIPKDLDRYPFVFFVDDATGLMLKMVVLTQQGQLMERFHFVHIEVGKVDESDLVPQITGQEEEIPDPAAAPIPADTSSASGWHLAWLPSGFIEQKPFMHPLVSPLKGQQIYRYSDGLSAFSVFIEPAKDDIKHDTATQLGSTSVISHLKKINGVFFLVTVVGEIPIMTAKQIALSVEPSS